MNEGTGSGITASSAFLAVFLAMLGSCKAADTTIDARTGLGGRVEFVVSGGFAGVRQRLVINDTGKVEAHDERRRKSVYTQLDPGRLAEIRTALANIDVHGSEVSPKRNSRCADCLHYSVRAELGEQRYRTSLVSTDISNSPYRELVGILSRLLRDALSRPTNLDQ